MEWSGEEELFVTKLEREIEKKFTVVKRRGDFSNLNEKAGLSLSVAAFN